MEAEPSHAEPAERQRSHAPEVTIIVSDFHLGAGIDSHTGIRDPHERFANDGAFARFLDFVREDCQAHQRRCRLIILGDLFDLPRVDLGWQPRNADEALRAVLTKLSVIIAGHSQFFAALARYGGSGFPIHLMPGNHDLPIMCPDVSAWLTSTLSALTSGGAALTLRMHPWILYEPGLLYAEHGHQYHDINHYPALLAQAMPSAWLDQHTIGAAFDHFVMRLATLSGGATSHAANVSALVKHLLTTPRLAMRAAPISVRFGIELAHRLAVPPAPYRPDHRAAYRNTWIASHAPQVGLDRDTLSAIDHIAAVRAAQIRRRLAGALMSSVVSPISRLSRLPFRSTGHARPVMDGATNQSGTQPPYRFQLVPSHRSQYMYQAARAIHEVLASGGYQVPFYVFGHTHHAEVIPLSSEEPSPYYVNSGSWLHGQERLHRLASPVYPFIWIERQEGLPPIAQLMRWDDQEGWPAVVSPPAGAPSASGLRPRGG